MAPLCRESGPENSVRNLFDGCTCVIVRENGKAEDFEQILLILKELVADQTGWFNQHLIYADSIAAMQLMRGDRAAAINTMQ